MDKVLCKDCYIQTLDEDEQAYIHSGRGYVKTSDDQKECDCCGEYGYYALGIVANDEDDVEDDWDWYDMDSGWDYDCEDDWDDDIDEEDDDSSDDKDGLDDWCNDSDDWDDDTDDWDDTDEEDEDWTPEDDFDPEDKY